MAAAPTKQSGSMWVWWVVLIVVFAIAAALVLLKPWESDPASSPTPSATPSPAPSTSPSPLALSAETAVIANPVSLTWTGSYFTGDSGETKGEFPPFRPDGDYPGVSEVGVGDDGFTWTVTGAAPPWFEDMKPFSFVNASAKGIGEGVEMDAYLVDGGFMQSSAADGSPTAWILAAFTTDQHSTAPRWAICRFHMTGADATAAVDAMYCDQAEEGAVGDTWAFHSYAWRLDGDVLVEQRFEPWLDEGDPAAPRTFTIGDGPGGLVLGVTERGDGDTFDATWNPEDYGLRIPTQREVNEANGCEYDDQGELASCPDL